MRYPMMTSQSMEVRGMSLRNAKTEKENLRVRESKARAQSLQPALFLPKPSNKQGMPFRPIKSNSVNHGFSRCGVDHLANSQQGRAPRHREQFGIVRIRGGCVHLFIRVRQLDTMIMLQCGKKRIFPERRRNKIRKFGSRKVTCFQRKRILSGKPKPIDFHQVTGRG